MTISEKELQQIVNRAVKIALEEIQSVPATEISREDPAENVEVKPFTDEELDEAMKLMASNRGKDDEPKVGIFWFDPRANDLFGVRSHRVTDYVKPNSRSEFGSVSCSEMHEDVWKKEFRKQKYQYGGRGPFVGAYQDKPRGCVFFHIDNGTFEVAVGKWIEEYPQAYEEILKEFNLPPDKTTAKYAYHWDIGQSWR